MNCQEVRELVQRELDRDLNAVEQKQLYEHLEHCPSCMEMFHRLKRLSEALEELPRVSPPVSIVDTILPKLRELGYPHPEGERQPAAQPAAFLSTVFQAAKRGWKKLPAKAAGGVIAAGLVIGLWAAQQHHPQFEQASLNGAENTQFSQGNVKTEAFSAADADAVKKNDASTASPLSGPNEGAKHLTPISASQSGVSPQADTSSKEAKEKVPADARMMAHESAAAGTDDPKEQHQEEPILFSRTEPSAAPDEPVARSEKDQAVSGIASVPGNGEPVQQRRSGEEASHGPMMGIAAASVPELATKDGNLVAYVMDGRVHIRNSDMETVYTSSRHWDESDEILLESWSDDNRYLTYRVNSGQKTMRFTVDVEQKTEHEK